MVPAYLPFLDHHLGVLELLLFVFGIGRDDQFAPEFPSLLQILVYLGDKIMFDIGNKYR